MKKVKVRFQGDVTLRSLQAAIENQNGLTEAPYDFSVRGLGEAGVEVVGADQPVMFLIGEIAAAGFGGLVHCETV